MNGFLIQLIGEVLRSLNHEMHTLGLLMHCTVHGVVDPYHPRVLARAVCVFRDLPGYAHPAGR